MEKMKANEGLFAIRVLIVVLLIVCGVAPAWAGHDTHYARVSVTASPTGQGKVYMTTVGDYVPEDGDWENSMSATWNCKDGVNNEEDTRIYYVHAQPASGYHFVKWSSSSSGSDSQSTAAKYAYETSADSESSGSPTANSLYAIFAVNPEYTCTFLTSENGTFKYKYGDSEEVRVESQHSVTTNQNFTFTALPDAGYTLYGWYTKSGGTKTYFDYTSTTISSYALPGNISIGVDFVPEGTPIFQIKGSNQTYTDLKEAISACGSATKTIVLINNGTLPAGNYTIPANVTLLIPFDEVFTCYTGTPALTTNSFLIPEVYRTLTMAPGATLTVNGAISVSAKLSSRSGYGPNGATSGKYGAIKMLSEGNTKSKITLKSGAKLYGWGYIYGEGAVEALSGSTVYEGFVITDWRGGNNTLDMYDNRSTYKVFPFNQYYIQNIEVPLTIHKGATETVYSSVYGNGSDNPLSITMVGESSGLFRLTGTGAKLTKWYDPLYDRQHYELEGAAAINAISFSASGMTVSSSEYVLPITNNMDITVRSGATVSIAEDVCIMADASVTVEQGATMNIASAKNVYVYDKQAYTNAGTYTTSRGTYPTAGPGRYAAGAYVRRISYSPSWAALPDREIRRLQNMSSAHFQVNGTLTVNGKLYTTEGGADIFSTTDGAAVNLVTGAGTATKTYQVDHENYDAYYYTIPVTSAKLHNADGSYQATAGNTANTAWAYAHGHWGWCIIWRLEDGTELKRMYQPSQPNATWISSNAPETSKPDEGTCSYVFNGWNTVTNTSQQEIILTADYTKTCAEYYDVLWKSEDGTETYETDEHVGNGETTRYNGAAPSKADDETNGFTYTFDGWTTEPNGGGTKYNIGETPAATGDITYYAHFAATEVAAIITANGVVSYYPSIADAFTAANASDYTPTIQVWRDAPNTPALTYTAKNHCTLDLNGHTVSGTEMPLLTINDEGYTFTVTDRTETKEGRLAGTSGVSQAFVVHLVFGVFRLEAGTVYGQYTASTVMAGVYAENNREIIINGGTIQVDANSGTGYGIFAQGKGTINGGTIRVESSAKSAYAVQAQGANGNVTVTDGKFYAAGSNTVTCVLAKGGALTVNGGYYNTATNLTTYLGAGRHIINLPSSELPYQYKVGTGGYTVTFQNTDGAVLQSGLWENGTTPEYTGDAPTKPGDTRGEFMHSGWTPELAPVTGDAIYTATYVPTPPVASVTISGTTTNYIHFSDAWSAVNAATAASTLTLLQDVTVTTELTYNNSNNKNCTLNLNGHTLTSNTSQPSPLHINNTNVTFTVTDGTVGKSGKLSLNSSSSSAIFGAYVESGNLLLNTGTIEVTSSTATACGVTIHYGTFTMNGGTIHVKTTNGKEGRGIYANSTTTVNGGTILVEAAGTAYGVRHDGGIMTINGGKFNISGSTASYMNYKEEADTKLIIKGGYYNISNRLGTYVSTPYHIFNLTSGAEYEEGYRYKVAQAYTLAWETDGELSGEGYTPAGLTAVGTPIVAPTSTKEGYVFAGWTPSVAETMPAANTSYTATWAVASVTINGSTTLYTTFAPAWTAVNSATAASTLKLLQDVTVNSILTYDNSSKKNCTFNLNGHTVSTTNIAMFNLNTADITFTITDNSEGQSGKVSVNSTSTGSTAYGVLVSKGRFVLDAGTIEANLKTATSQGVRVANGASFTMNGGKIDVETTNNRNGDGVFVNTTGTATIGGGEIHVRAAATGYAIEVLGTTTVTDGKFSAEGGTSAACVHTEGSGASLTLQGGYYSLNTNLAANCAANYHVFPNSDASYPHKVAEGYTVTFNTNGHGSAPEAQLIEKNTHASEPTAPTATGYTFGGWYKEAGCETPWDFASDVVTAATTLYAKWAAINYSISYDLAGGSVSSANPTTYNVETATFTLNNPTKEGYTFLGWTGSNGSTPQTAVSIANGSTGDKNYTANWAVNVASVTANSTTAYYTSFADAWTAANSATTASTLKLLDDVDVTTQLTYDNNNNKNCTLDLNGHTLTINTSKQSPLHINNTNVTFTVTDGTEEKSGKLSLNTSFSSSAIFGAFVDNGHLLLNGGTIEVISGTATTCGVTANSNGTFTMNAGTIHVVTTNSKEGRGVYSVGTATVNGGTVRVEADGDGYAIKRDGGNITINNGKFNISGSTASVSYNANPVIKGGYYNTDTNLETCVTSPYHVLPNDDATYRYKVAEAYNLTWTTDGELSGEGYTPAGLTEVGTPIVAPTPTKAGYTFYGWTPAVADAMPSADTEYTAQWAVASVTIGETTTLHTTFADAWTAANTAATAASTLKLLDDVHLTTGLEYTNASKNCTLDLNGHIISGSATPLLKIAQDDITFTLTDLTEAKEGRIECNTSDSGQKWAVEVTKSTLRFEGGTIYAKNTHAGDLFIGIYSGASGVVEISGGNIHTVTTAANPAFCVLTFGTATISGGSFKVESGAAGYAVEAYGDNTNILITGGNFYATGSSAACVHRSKGTLTLQGGYYSLNTNLAANCAANYHVFPNSDASYPHKVTEGYMLTWNLDGGDISIAGTPAGYVAVDDPITAPTVTKTGYTFAGWSSAVAETMPAENTEYTATWTPNTNTAYTVKHYLENLDGTYPSTPADTENLTGTTDASVTPAVKTYAGFTAPGTQTTTILADGSLVVEYKYTRNSYQLTWDVNGGTVSVAGTAAGPVKYGATITAPTVGRTGYNFTGWTPAMPSTMPIDGVTCTAQWEIIPYDISYTLDGGTESSANPTTYNVETATFTLNNPTKEGYTFLGWTGSNGSTPQTAVSIANGSTGDKNYTANWAVNVASVTANSTTAYYTSFADAWTAANSATAASTLTLLQDISGLSSTRTYSASHDLMLDLNGHTLSGSGTSLFQIGCAENTFTVTDGSANHDGKLSFTTAESSTSSFHCVIVNNGTFVLEAGTIEATSSTVSIGAVKVAGGTFTMKENGAVHAKYTGPSGKNSRFVNATGGTTNINGGTIHLESTSDAIGVVYSSGTVTITGGNFKIEADHIAAVTNQNGAKNNLNIRGGYYSANSTGYFEPHVKTPYHRFPNSDATYIYRVAEAYTVTFKNGDVTLQSDLWEKGTTPVYAGATPAKAATAQYTYTFNGWNAAIVAVTGNATYNATFSSTVNTYTVLWKDEDGTTLETDENVPYGTTPTYDGATPTKATDAEYAYTFNGWDPAVSAVTADAVYTATYTTTPVVASVTINSATTYYTTIAAAFAAANASATYEPTITLLQDAVTTTTSMLSYTGAKNCTLNLNGHTLSSTTAQALLYINHAGITFTITDLTASKSGSLHLESAFTDKTWCVYVAKGNLIMDAGTVFLRSKANQFNEGIRIDPTASTFTMYGGKVHVVTSEGQPACGIVSRGVAAIHGGEIQVEASGAGYGIEARVSDDGNNIGNVTVYGGKFLVTGTTAACAYRSNANATLKLQGGYYSTDTNLATYCAADYAVLPTGDATYPFTVAENFTDITVDANETVTIDGNTTTNTTTVHVSGTLEVAENVTLTTTDLILEATPSSSGEIIGDVAVNGNAYFDLMGNFKARTWYAIAVPWQVEVPEYALGDVSLSNDGENYTPQTLGSTFDLIYYDGARRATGASKAWNYVEDDPAAEHVMLPGRAYMIYLTTNASVIRFRKSTSAALHTNELDVLKYPSSVDANYADWNGIANPATFKAFLNVGTTDNLGQVYNAETKGYEWFHLNTDQLQVGQPIFVQPIAAKNVVAERDIYPSAAPRRAKANVTPFTRYEVALSSADDQEADRIIVRMDEDKETDAYTVGQDLAKMGLSTVVPQMWVNRYHTQLCVNTTSPTNNTADYPLSLFVPKAGEYRLSSLSAESNEQTTLYLTYDGRVIWILNYAPYSLTMEGGTNTHYGLRIVYAPQATTDLENGAADNVPCTKVLVDDHVFIIRGGRMYSMDGQRVK